MKFFEWIQRYSCFVEKNESPKLVYIRGNNGINKQDTFLKESSWRKSLMGAELSLRSKSFLRWQWPSFGLTAPTIMVDFYAFARSTLVHAGEWQRWETRTQKVGYRFVFFWIKGPPNGGTVFNNGVVYFNRIALLFFISFFLSSFLPFFFFAGTKAEAFHCPSWPSSALIFDQNRAVFWPRSSTNLQHFFTTSRKEINLEKFVFLIYDIRSCLLKNSNALFGNHAQDLLRWKFGREPDDFGTEWWFSMMGP